MYVVPYSNIILLTTSPDIYTQEVVDLQVYTNPYTQEVQLQWETSYPLIANEIFIIWLSRVNVSDEYEEIGRTDDTEYSLPHLSHNYHYSIRVQVVSRLNNTTYTDLYYVHTETVADNIYSLTVIISVAIVIIIILLLVAVVSIVLSCVLLIIIGRKRRGHKAEHNKPSEQSSTTPKYYEIGQVATEYIPLSDKRHDQSGYSYEPMESVATGNKNHVTLEDQRSNRNYSEKHSEPNLVSNYENLGSVAK